MAINISVQYNGGLLPDMILLKTQGYYYRGTRLNSLCNSILLLLCLICTTTLFCFIFDVFLVSVHGD